jgi:hypothetical protein
MNTCMGIKRDLDINEKPGAAERAVVAFKQDAGPKPILQPMKIDWAQGRASKWNQSLFKDFLQYFLNDEEDKRPHIMPNAWDVEDIFYTRLDRLRRYRKKNVPHDGEGQEDFDRRQWVAKMATLKRQRRKTRQRQVSLSIYVSE